MNAAGDVCGYGYGPEPLAWPEGYWRAFYLPIDCGALGGTTTYQIPALSGVTRTDYSSAAYGVNKFGQTVGYTQKEDQNHNLISVAFIYSPDFGGSISDLSTYPLGGGSTPASLGWTLTSAVSINDSGVMVGYGSNALGNTCWIIYPKCQH